MNKKQVLKNGIKVNMTTIEFSLLELLIENLGVPLSRIQILDSIWGYTPQRSGDTRIVDVHISRLRLKLEDDPRNPDFIKTRRGIGYLFQNY
jgi:OmpR family response regulator RpaB